ncbi:MAG: nucleotidyltransferase family protein [Actinomycetota bacterium]|nr:nucleotidyltransferase family protein [Actinomycetota bacterium]
MDTLPLHDAGTARVTSPILPDVVDEARRLLAAAEEEGLRLRLIGGVAVRLHVQGELHPAFAREIRDIDVVTGKGEGRRAGAFIEAQGYVPNRTFNAMHGARRMLFYDEANGRQLDVFVNTFEMCHVLPVGEHLDRDPVTVPLADLLLTKLQIVTLNAKDRSDAYALVLEHELGSGDVEFIDAARIADLCARDWGLYRTLQINLERLSSGLAESGLSGDEQRLIAARLAGLTAAIEAAPKSVKWKARARVGDRVRWYEEPDEVAQGGY